MRSSTLAKMRGYVKIEVRGKQIEAFINRAIQEKFIVWNMRRTSSEQVELFIVLPHLFKLRPLLRSSRCRLRILERHGLPFLLDKLERRKFFAVGIVLFVIGIYAMSSFVWSIRVEGNERISTQTILDAANKQGIQLKKWKPLLREPEELSRSLLSELPGAAWIGVDIKGTRVYIKVVETTRPDDRELLSPRHLIAAKSAEVTEILAEKGKAMVKPHSVVRQGDILISGIVGNDEHQDVVVAKGIVRGIVWEKVQVQIPLIQKTKVYIGETKKRYYIAFGERALKVWGFGALPFELHESEYMSHTLQWRNYKLPVAWMNEKVLAVEQTETSLEPADARQIALEQARLNVIAEAGPDARLANEKLLSERVEDGILHVEVLMEIERDIAEEQAIVPEQSPNPAAEKAPTP
jgi:similar to stage IV sporulation protein